MRRVCNEKRSLSAIKPLSISSFFLGVFSLSHGAKPTTAKTLFIKGQVNVFLYRHAYPIYSLLTIYCLRNNMIKYSKCLLLVNLVCPYICCHSIIIVLSVTLNKRLVRYRHYSMHSFCSTNLFLQVESLFNEKDIIHLLLKSCIYGTTYTSLNKHRKRGYAPLIHF